MNATQVIEMIQTQNAKFVKGNNSNGYFFLQHDSFRKGFKKLSRPTANSVITKLELNYFTIPAVDVK